MSLADGIQFHFHLWLCHFQFYALQEGKTYFGKYDGLTSNQFEVTLHMYNEWKLQMSQIFIQLEPGEKQVTKLCLVTGTCLTRQILNQQHKLV